MKNLVYFCYYLKITDWSKLKKHRNFIKEVYGISGLRQIWDMLWTSLNLGIAFHEYYYYGFYNKTIKQQNQKNQSFIFSTKRKCPESPCI